KTLQNFIGGEYVDSAAEETDTILDPATGETIAVAPRSGPEDVDRAVASARGAFVEWGESTPAERSLALLKLADAIEGEGDALARLESQNAGKPLQSVFDDEITFMV